MSHIQTIHLEHLPPNYDLHIALYRNVTNAAFLHQQLLAGNTDFEYALIDASVILSKVHILAAAYRAVNDLLENRLRSRNVHSEIVFSLSPNNNIAESFRRFGLTPTTTTNLLIIKLSTPHSPIPLSSVTNHLTSSIEGENIPFTDENLAVMVDEKRARKIYKLNAVAGGAGSGAGKKGVNGNGAGGGGGDERMGLLLGVLGAMALRSVTN
ncbi:kinase binding protein CGI-121-domain-containing protein [Cadophora sp. MPI-SDFR-AT-0126]|nr:kinase binding protein CGI-121-domain-containing protein [Leotiomycetes sp. MPI-SDFR-AT-0126]